MQNIDQCIKPALLIVNFFYINVKIDLTFLTHHYVTYPVLRRGR